MEPVSIALFAIAIIAAIATCVIIRKVNDLATLRIGARMLFIGAVIVAGLALASCGTAGIVMRCIAADRTVNHC